MRHRLYYVLPDVECARRVLDDLLINRIDERHIHFMSHHELPEDMPQCNLLQKTDVLHGAGNGMLIGGALGVALGIVLVLFPFEGMTAHELAVVAAVAVGVLFGGWVAGMMGISLPNSRLQRFRPELERGQVLLIVDVPARCIQRIEEVLAKHHPEMRFAGGDPNVPVFP